MFIKPYFQSKTNYNIKLNKLKVTAKLNKLEVTVKLDKLKVPLFTLKPFKEFTEPVKPTIKYG